MNTDDRQMRHVIAGTNSANEGIKNMPYWEAKKLAGDLRNYLSGDCPLEDREATLGALVLADKRSAEISGTDGSYDEQDQAHKNREIVEDFLKDGDIKSALKFNKTLEKAGQPPVNVKVKTDEATQAYLDKLSAARSERVPILQEQLNIGEEEATEWFDKFEAHAYGKAPPIIMQEAEKPAAEKPDLLEEDNNLPDGWTA